MTRKKNVFFTFCFSLIPGAGEMYMGFFKQGISLMVLFFLIMTLSGYLNLGVFMFFQPVLWFYSFFHVHNLKSLPDDEFYALEDDFLFHADRIFDQEAPYWNKYKKLLSVLLIFFGANLLWDLVMDLIRAFLPMLGIHNFSLLYSIQRAVPQIIIAIGLIAAGYYMIKSKKDELMDSKEEPKKEIQILIEDTAHNGSDQNPQ